MRIYEIAAFIFVLNMVGAAFTTIGIGGYEELEYGQQTIEEKVKTITAETEQKSQGIFDQMAEAVNWLTENVKMVVFAVGTFVSIFTNALIVEPMMRSMFPFLVVDGNLHPFGWIIIFIIWFVYLVGLLEFISGRDIEK